MLTSVRARLQTPLQQLQGLAFGLIVIGLVMLQMVWLTQARAQANAREPQQDGYREARVSGDAFTRTEVPAWVLPMELAPDRPDQQLVLRLWDQQVRIDKESETFVRAVFTARDAEGVRELGHITLFFIPEYERVRLHAVRIHRDGKVLDQTAALKPRFLQRESGLEQGIYSGEVTASILLEDLRPGDTVEYLYTVAGANPVFGGKAAGSVRWTGGMRIGQRRLVLNTAPGRNVAHRVIGSGALPDVLVQDSLRDGWRQRIFESTNLQAVRSESNVPRGVMMHTGIQYSEFGSWGDVARWAHEVFSDTSQGDSIRTIAQRLRSAGDASAQALAALQFVQEEIRYFSVSLGESSHRPYAPAEVVRRRFGDCKDKSVLLVALLRELGIPAQPVLISLRDNQIASQLLPSPLAFDHVIVRIDLPGQTTYVDPTMFRQSSPLATIGQPHEGADVLVVQPHTGALARIVSANAAQAATVRVSEVLTMVAMDKPGELEVVTEYNGLLAERVRQYQSRAASEERKRNQLARIHRRFAQATWLEDPRIEDDVINNRIKLTERFRLPKPAEPLRDAWRFAVMPANVIALLAPMPETGRLSPIGLAPAQSEAVYSFELRLPPNVTSMEDPSSTRIASPFFDWEASSRFRGNVAREEHRLRILSERVPPADFPRYIEDMGRVNKLSSAVVVTRAMLRSESDAALSAEEAFERRLKKRFEDRLGRINESIREGKLAPLDLALAYDERASTYSTLLRLDEALADANEAVKREPDSAQTLLTRGVVHFRRGDLARAIADYSRGLRYGAELAHDLYFRRGQARLYSGQLDAAISDFDAAVKATDDTDRKLFHQLWWMAALGRAGKPVPDEARRLAAEQAQGPWPRPLVAMLAGAIKPADVIAQAQSRSGEDRLMHLCEAWFFIGQWHLIQGQTELARVAFEKAHSTRVIVYLEHESAGVELKQLAAR